MLGDRGGRTTTGRVKRIFTVIAVLTSITVFSLELKGEGPQEGHQLYHYTGTVKAKSEAAHVVTVETQRGPVNFHYQRHGKKECAGFRELAEGDNVKVISPENKALSEATCITKTVPVKVPR